MSRFIDTYGGSFGPGGQGGGIFQTSVQGLGSLGPHTRFGVRGLGEVPASCWDTPGFKDCHTRVLGDAYNVCKKQGIQQFKTDIWGNPITISGQPQESQEWQNCYKSTSDELIARNCVTPLCSGASSSAPTVDSGPSSVSLQCEDLPSGTFPKGTYSNWTLLLQNCINNKLGPGKVVVDGKLGPGTCAAAKLAGLYVPRECSGTGTSTSSGGGGQSSLPSSTENIQQLKTKSSMGIWLAAVAVVGAGAYFLTKKKRGSK